jgi:arylsulfatase A-like enzyme
MAALPRVTWIAFGDTDNRAHEGEYEAYLAAAAEADLFVRGLWEAIEADPRTAGRTILIVTSDHGRGAAENDRWTGHGSGRWRGIRVPGLHHEGSDAVFIAVRGPGVALQQGYDASDCAALAQVGATILESVGLGELRAADAAAPLRVFAR